MNKRFNIGFLGNRKIKHQTSFLLALPIPICWNLATVRSLFVGPVRAYSAQCAISTLYLGCSLTLIRKGMSTLQHSIVSSVV